MLVLLATLAAAAAQPATAEPARTDDPVICTKQNVGDEVGTRMRTKKKVCMRKSDRDFIDKQNKQAVGQIINDGNDRSRFIPLNPR